MRFVKFRFVKLMVSRMEKDIKDMKELSEAKKVQDKKNMALQEQREHSRNYVKRSYGTT